MKIDDLDNERLRKIWLESNYPLTIINDRYGGCYSKGNFTAFPCYYWQIPGDGPDGSDIDCSDFWSNYEGYCGIGDTPEEALKDLIDGITKGEHYNEREIVKSRIEDFNI